MNEFLFLNDNNTKDWFHKKYVDKLGIQAFDRGRWITMKIALNLFLQSEGFQIIETGCQRDLNEWGSGGSTTVFHEFIERYGGFLTSVDNCEEHINRARAFVDHADRVKFVLSDSVAWLESNTKNIDFLYLDSFDYPYGKLLEKYGGKKDLNAAIAQVSSFTEAEIVDAHSDIILSCQEHCLKEIQAAHDQLYTGSIVLIDDNSLAGGGKPRLARQWMLDNGYTLVLDYQQTLWLKE